MSIESEIEFSELSGTSVNPEISIKYGKVPANLGESSIKGVAYEAKPGKLLLRVPNVANYLVSNGNSIIIDAFPGVEESTIKLFILGSAIGALLHQRGVLAIHSSAIALGTDAFLICGTSGAGKSTLAAMLVSKGYKLLTDDVSAIAFENDKPVILPGINVLKLWKDSLLKLNFNPDNLTRVREGLEKFYVPIKNEVPSQKLFLKKIYIINTGNTEEITVIPLKGIEKFTALKNHTYRFSFVKGMGLENNHFESAGKLASLLKISRIMRYKKGFDLEKLADVVINDFNNELNA